MYPDTDSSNTTSSEDTEPSSEETWQSLHLTEATQYITQLDSVKWTRADTRKTQEGDSTPDHVHESRNKRRKI
ncbi:hypothetical protein BpHYR1_031778 [Brachionus plicatilis]|uniref:Uncharacterized protein n=1 Tax=Brachionus plicatilis TaxID=10195 RepID=A0A3M7RX13_BRAPC|nr:hypothetical protein BpHYR1_031778 [Brachionus plicatilis]